MHERVAIRLACLGFAALCGCELAADFDRSKIPTGDDAAVTIVVDDDDAGTDDGADAGDDGG